MYACFRQHAMAGARHKLLANMQVRPQIAVRIATDIAKDRMSNVQLIIIMSIRSSKHAPRLASDPCKKHKHQYQICVRCSRLSLSSLCTLPGSKFKTRQAALTLIY